MLDLEAAVLLCPLRLEGCQVAAPIRQVEAQGPAVRFVGCELASLDAAQLSTRGDVSLADSRVLSEVRLLGAHIGGVLEFTGATLSNDAGPALTADGLRVDQAMFCRDGFSATGEVRLPGAHIGGQLEFTAATLSNDAGPALTADGLRVDQAMFCRDGFSATGEVRLPGAHIGSALEFTGATLSNDAGPALTADGLRVDQAMFCRDGFSATGE